MSAAESSHRQTRFLLFGGFGGLLLLMGFLGVSGISFLSQVQIREEQIRQSYVRRDRAVELLRSDIYLSGTILREFLLDDNEGMAAVHRRQFLQKKTEIETETADYGTYAYPEQHDAVRQLDEELNGYFGAADPALGWNVHDRATKGRLFMQDQFLPRRMAALGIADRIQQISEKQLETSSDAVAVLLSSFRTKLLVLLLTAVLTGMALAGLALWRLLRLERESQERFREVLHTREELKRLSGELVTAQESERRRISRELHDEVGQVLSAIVLGIGNLRSALSDDDREEAFRQLQLVQDMTERNVSVVRNISLLLRPTMLDDLGLLPALKWLAREVSRNSAMEVDIVAESFVDDLPDEHRTCVFRVVQEAIRNASRHSCARQVRVLIKADTEHLKLTVRDDGKGFVPSEEPGLGILGMQERVMRLGGELHVQSEPGRGTTVSFTLPLPIAPISVAPALHGISPFRTA